MRTALLGVMCACYTASLPQGVPCGSGGSCPFGQMCTPHDGTMECWNQPFGIENGQEQCAWAGSDGWHDDACSAQRPFACR